MTTVTVKLDQEHITFLKLSDKYEISIDAGLLTVWDYGVRDADPSLSGIIAAYAPGAWLWVTSDTETKATA